MIIWSTPNCHPPSPWLKDHFNVEAFSVRYLEMVRAKDRDIFSAAREAADVVVLTKDSDFVLLQERLGPPPAIMWVRCGNTSNAYLKRVLQRTFNEARRLIEAGEVLIEFTDLQ